MIAMQSWLNQSKTDMKQPSAMRYSRYTRSSKQEVDNSKVYIIDNKCSSDSKEAMKKYEIYFQLAPPHMYRRNAAEQAIRTYKNHFIAGF